MGKQRNTGNDRDHRMDEMPLPLPRPEIPAHLQKLKRGFPLGHKYVKVTGSGAKGLHESTVIWLALQERIKAQKDNPDARRIEKMWDKRNGHTYDLDALNIRVKARYVEIRSPFRTQIAELHTALKGR